MKISPRYGDEPIIELDGPPDAIATPLLRQRRRVAGIVAALPADQWELPTRCEGWRVKDVIAHMTSTDHFWQASIQAGLSGTPTRFLDGFDPKATPAALVDAVREEPISTARDNYLAGCQTLCATVEALGAESWSAFAESPAGHVTLTTLAHHALWDTWIHERDILLPLAAVPDEKPDEIISSLRYVAALSSMFALQHSSDPRAGLLVVDAVQPSAAFTVVVDHRVRVVDGEGPEGARLTGNAVDLLEAFSARAPFAAPIPPDAAWLVTGLSRVFETVPA